MQEMVCSFWEWRQHGKVRICLVWRLIARCVSLYIKPLVSSKWLYTFKRFQLVQLVRRCLDSVNQSGLTNGWVLSWMKINLALYHIRKYFTNFNWFSMLFFWEFVLVTVIEVHIFESYPSQRKMVRNKSLNFGFVFHSGNKGLHWIH